MPKPDATKTDRKMKLLSKLIKSPAVAVFIVCVVLISFNLVMAYHLRPFTSDDVFWQLILQTWRPFSGHTVVLGNSSVYADKIPLYLLLGHFFNPGRKLLFLESYIFALSGFSLFYASCMYFLKKAGANLSYSNLLPFVWLSSFGYWFALLYLNPDWRGFQLGVSFVTFALVAAIYSRDIEIKSLVSKILLLLAVAFAGLQTYSDPYFLYFTVGPIIIFSGALLALKKIGKRQALLIGGSAILSVVFAKILTHIAYSAGIRTAISYPTQFINFNALSSTFEATIHSMLIIFGADFFNLPVANIITIGALLNFFLLCFIAYKVCSNSLRARRYDIEKLDFSKLWILFFSAVCLLIFLAYTTSTLTSGTATYRYFLLLLLLFILMFSIALGSMRNSFKKYALMTILVLSILLNLGLTTFNPKLPNQQDQQPTIQNNANRTNYALIAFLGSRGLDKGYANYWWSNITTYLSNRKVTTLPTICNTSGDTARFHWLIDNSTFNKKSPNSFYIYDPTLVSPPVCTDQQVIAQFGEPTNTYNFDGLTIMTFNYDIGSRMPK